MKTLQTLTDPVYTKNPNPGKAERFFVSMIKDERDLPFVYLTLQITFTLIPLAVLLYLPFVTGWAWWVCALVYLYLNNFFFKGPFGLMLHCTSHRVFFKPAYSFLNHYLPWVIGPFFGQTPETYFSHHIGMHHAENNLPEDESSTMAYQRDSLASFAHYFFDFLFVGIVRLSGYFIRKNRKKLMYRSVRGESLYIILCIVLGFINWPATLVVFVLPFLISRVIMMLGNWAQHSFIDAADPGNHYKNSITCINTKYNHKCWNDGYHISHHVRPALHWTEHPAFFTKTLADYIKHDAIVFDGIHFLHVFAWLMSKRYDKLAKHFVNLGNRYQSDNEIIDMLRSRTQRIEEPVLALYKAAS